MKYLIVIQALLLTTALPADDAKFLSAISQVESGDADTAVGPCGCRGRYQISKVVWLAQANDDWPYALAHNKNYSKIVAIRHLAWLKNRQPYYAKSGLADYYWLACAWRNGHRFEDRHETKDQYLARNDYAKRVLNLMRAGK